MTTTGAQAHGTHLGRPILNALNLEVIIVRRERIEGHGVAQVHQLHVTGDVAGGATD